MSQISPPIRILLIVAVAFLGAYMLFLRPKEEVVPPAETTPAPNTQTTEPAVTGPGKAVEAAQDAVAAANGETTAAAGESAAAAPGATAPATEGAKDLKGVPVKVRKAIRQGDVVVLLFWNRKGADDRDVRRSLRKVDTWDGRVVTQAAPLSAISRYGRIARGVDVNQSPTVVVVDPELHAETIVGYTDTETIDQTVVDALKNTTGLFTSAYLREIDAVCARYTDSIFTAPLPDTPAEFVTWGDTFQAKVARFSRQFAAVPAPKRFAAFRRANVRSVNTARALYADWLGFVGRSPDAARLIAGVDRYGARETQAWRGFNRRMDDRHVLSCGKHS